MKLHHLVLCLALALPTAAQERSVPAVLAAPGGRFVFGQISSMARDQYMLDTQSGRLWQIVTDKDGSLKLQPVPYTTMLGTLTFEPVSGQQEHAEIDAKLRQLSTVRTNAAAAAAAEITQKYFGTNQPPVKLDMEPKKPDEKK